jgi:hypothetical protein
MILLWLKMNSMIVYNVTIKVNQTVADEWLHWLQTEHIPEVVATGCFTHATVLRLLEVDDTEGPTHTVQYFAESKALYNQYIQSYAAPLREKSFAKWGDKFIAFRSVMQVVN